LWVTGLVFGQDTAYSVERRLVRASHQLGKDLKCVRELVQLRAITLQGKVPRLDEGAVQDSQQFGLNILGCEIGHGNSSKSGFLLLL
jgi:hypothetical protein